MDRKRTAHRRTALCSLCAAPCKEACRHVMTNCNQTAGDMSANFQTSASEAGVVCLPCIRLTVDLNVFAVISTCCICFKCHQSVVEEVAEGTLRREFRLFIHLFIFYFLRSTNGPEFNF